MKRYCLTVTLSSNSDAPPLLMFNGRTSEVNLHTAISVALSEAAFHLAEINPLEIGKRDIRVSCDPLT